MRQTNMFYLTYIQTYLSKQTLFTMPWRELPEQ